MTITLELPPELEARFLAEAREKGMTLNAYIQERLARSVQAPPEALTRSASEINRLLDEAADMVPAGLALSDFAMSRESIYGEDE
jgi:hypothetical protein